MLDIAESVTDGPIRFAVVAAEVTAVVVESWGVGFPNFDYVRWLVEDRPDSFESVFAGGFTLPHYGAVSAAELLDLAAQYATAELNGKDRRSQPLRAGVPP